MAHPKRRISHKKELYYISCILALVFILLVSFLGPGGYRDLQKARIHLQEQRERIDKLERDNNERRKSIEELQSDKEALEKYAREKGYGKTGDIIQRVPSESEEKAK